MDNFELEARLSALENIVANVAQVMFTNREEELLEFVRQMGAGLEGAPIVPSPGKAVVAEDKFRKLCAHHSLRLLERIEDWANKSIRQRGQPK